MDYIKKLDAFPKASDDFRVKTSLGAIISLTSIALMILLFCTELNYFLKTETIDHMYVNATRAGKLKVSFDISFPEIACNLLSLDAVDETGVTQKDAIVEIYKHKLNKEGEKEGEAELHMTLGDTVLSEEQLKTMSDEHSGLINSKIDKCGNCYGAGLKGECCNTCDDVKLAYDRIGWRFKTQGIAQCHRELFLNNMKDQFAETGGCQIYGNLHLNKASGHFHIAPHKKLHETGLQNGLFNLMDLISFTFDQFNITHTIESLSFGDHFPGIKSPLDSETRTIQDTHGMFQYYIKVVPTIFKGIGREPIESNQYSVTEHLRHLAPGSGRGLPGVYFYYELSPVQANFEERRLAGGWMRFIMSICAIVGGSYTVMGLLDILMSKIAKLNNKGLGQ